MSYETEKNKKNTETLFRYLELMPEFYRTYMMSIPVGTMTLQTKKEYAYKSQKFFYWLIQSNPVYKNYSMKDFKLQDMEQITPVDANEYAVYLSMKYKPKSVNAYLSAISSMYDELIRFNRVAANPFSAIKWMKEKDRIAISLNKDECQKILNVAAYGTGLTKDELKYHHPIRDTALISMFLDTGCRASEMAGMDVKDIDMQECKVLISGKGGKIYYVYFSDETKCYLERYLEYRLHVLLKAQDAQEAMWLSSRGTRYSVRSMELLIVKYKNAAGITKDIHLHSLRHSTGQILYDTSGNLELIRQKLHHSNISTSQIYAQSSDLEVKEHREFRFQ